MCGLEPGPAHVEVLVGDLARVQRQLVEDLGQDRVLLLGQHLELGPEDLRVEQVLDPQADPRRLVGVGGADAALGGAELAAAEAALGEPVDLLVVREDQVGVAADLQARRVDAPAQEHVHLGDEHAGVDHHAVADHRGDVVVEDAARAQLEGEALAVDHQGVAGVVAALVADDQLHLLGDEVGELPLALVAPLGTDHHGRWHGPCSSQTANQTEGRSLLPGAHAGPCPHGLEDRFGRGAPGWSVPRRTSTGARTASPCARPPPTPGRPAMTHDHPTPTAARARAAPGSVGRPGGQRREDLRRGRHRGARPRRRHGRLRRRPVHRHHGPVGLGQEHADALPGRARRAHQRQRVDRGHQPHRAQGEGPHQAAARPDRASSSRPST